MSIKNYMSGRDCWILNTIALILLSQTTGCSNITYKVGGEQFKNREEAIQRFKEINENVLSSIPPTQNTTNGTVIIALPTKEQIKQKGVAITVTTTAENVEKMVEFSTETTMITLQYMAKGIEKRHIFEQAAIVQVDQPENYQIDGNDFLVYYYLINPQTAGWYVKGKDFSEPKSLAVDTGKSIGVPRTIAWLDSLESIVSK